MMTRRPWLTSVALVAVMAVFVIVAVCRAAQDQPSARPDQNHQLLQRIEKLEARVNELEQRVPRLLVSQPAPRVLPDGKVQVMPKGWMRREFNGQWYYDIPLEQPPVSK